MDRNVHNTISINYMSHSFSFNHKVKYLEVQLNVLNTCRIVSADAAQLTFGISEVKDGYQPPPEC